MASGLAACSSVPRDPASVEYRTGSRYQAPSNPSHSSRPVPTQCQNYTVRSGDTLSEIAQRCGVSTRDLVRANNLGSADRLRVGQVLVMPRPSVHVVRRGENLYRIGLQYGVDYRELAALNNIRPPYALEFGQEIRLPQGVTSRPSPRPQDPHTDDRRRNEPQRPPVSSGPVRFDWPLRGTILSGFGPKPEGGRNDGINIAARLGDPVRAAAPGTVVYAGSELAGYGQLVLIRHENDFVTAYAHNSRLRVSEGDRVSTGQVIAEAGSSGTVSTAQLHFEIRRGTNPEDPMRYLQ